ncbi:MAG TPA: carbohydrate kinase family protein [Anaerolineaceae bacterium]|jgi:sugar/nucleoside kinase (ribokinase family)
MPGSDRCYDVLVFGEYYFDLIITGMPEMPRLGADINGTGMGVDAGGAFNTVRAFHRLGTRVGWGANFGNDLFSQFVLSLVQQEGVDTRLLRMHDHPLRFFSLSFSFIHERGFISYVDPAEDLDRAQLIRANPPSCVLLTGVEYGPGLLEIVATAHQVGAIVAMDCQHSPVTLDTPGLIEALRAIDVFLPNVGEAMKLTGASDAEDAIRQLIQFTPLVVVKQGAEGAAAYTHAAQVCAPAIPVQVVDTTGAGDAFNAGFLSNYLRGQDLLTCLRYGNICGGLCTTAHGSSATPTARQAEALFWQLYG